MAAVAFPQDSKTIKLPSGPTYSYVHIPAHSGKPTLLFLHGFPSSCYDWHFQIDHFSKQGYGVLAPDLLGYGETDRPTNAKDYRGKKMASEIVDILDHEKVSVVHGVAHDWGSFLLSRLANYYPARLTSAAFLVTAYTPPGGVIDLDGINTMTKQAFGYEVFGYWRFLEKEEAGEIVDKNFDSLWSIAYCEDPDEWKVHLAPLGALEARARTGKTMKIGSWAPDKATYSAIMKNNFGPAMNWYRSAIWGLNEEDEKSALAAGQIDGKLHMPVLMVCASRDPLASVTKAAENMPAVAENLKVETLPTGHWVQLEEADKVNKMLEEFVMGVEREREKL